jgi:hypothetical protein
MQLSFIDPRIHPVATQAMLDDPNLKMIIDALRAQAFRADRGWPYVEHLCEVAGRPAWAVDDDQLRHVLIGYIVFRPVEFDILDEKIRTAAREVFARLDAA